MSTPPETVAHLGRLVRAERARLGYTSIRKAAEAAGLKNYKTLSEFELGRTMPNSTNRALIEDLLMWRVGSLTDASAKNPDEVSLEFMRDWEREEPATAASELTDEALLTELIKRLDKIRLKVARVDEVDAVDVVKSAGGGADFKGTPAQLNHQNAYDLAAHTPRGGKKVDPRKATRK